MDLLHFLPDAWAGPLTALFQVLVIDLLLAGDNAVAVGLAAAGLPAQRRRQVILCLAWSPRWPCGSASP